MAAVAAAAAALLLLLLALGSPSGLVGAAAEAAAGPGELLAAGSAPIYCGNLRPLMARMRLGGGSGPTDRRLLRRRTWTFVFRRGAARQELCEQAADVSFPAYNGTCQEMMDAALAGVQVSMDAVSVSAAARRHAAALRYVEVALSVRVPKMRLRLANASIAATVQSKSARLIWGLDRIDQRSLPYDGVYRRGGTGAGVTVYGIDTGGLPEHPEFATGSGRSTSTRVQLLNFFPDRSTGRDCNGHGTHVAGSIGGKNAGVAEGVSVVSMRVFNCQGEGDTATVVRALEWVARNGRKPGVVNLSLGGPRSRTVDDAVAAVTRAGFVVVAAAGNDARDACRYSPAAAPSAITVAASDPYDNRASFSNRGSCVDIYAPGDQILSSFQSTRCPRNDCYAYLSGTSMAAPHVAGVAALYLQLYPRATPVQVARSLVAGSTRNAVLNNPSGTPNRLLFSLSFTAAGRGTNNY